MTVPAIHNIPEHEYEVTPLELFFDLVFVFAVSTCIKLLHPCMYGHMLATVRHGYK